VAATDEPDVWPWRLRIGDTSDMIRTRLVHLPARRIHRRIDAALKTLRLVDPSDDTNPYGIAGDAGCTGFGPGATGSSGGLGSVGITVAPTARAASPVVV
jgi:hypothetical protein